MSGLRTYFCIIGKDDVPVFESPLVQSANNALTSQQQDYLIQFILHASLDLVEQKMVTTNTMQLKIVDKFQDWNISSFVTAGKVKFLLAHDLRVDENAVRSFFNDCYELYIKVVMNPFHEIGSPIQSPVFEEKVKATAKKYFPRQ